jgi:hypothetical protein
VRSLSATEGPGVGLTETAGTQATELRQVERSQPWLERFHAFQTSD